MPILNQKSNSEMKQLVWQKLRKKVKTRKRCAVSRDFYYTKFDKMLRSGDHERCFESKNEVSFHIFIFGWEAA